MTAQEAIDYFKKSEYAKSQYPKYYKQHKDGYLIIAPLKLPKSILVNMFYNGVFFVNPDGFVKSIPEGYLVINDIDPNSFKRVYFGHAKG